jgi:hypothetical protein
LTRSCWSTVEGAWRGGCGDRWLFRGDLCGGRCHRTLPVQRLVSAGAAAARRRAMGHPSTAAGQAVAADNMAGQQQLPQNNPWLGRRADGWIVAVQFAARGIHRLGATTEGADADPQRRRQVDMTVVGALACAVTLATAIGHLETSGEPAQRGFEQHLADYGLRRSRGIWRPISDCGAEHRRLIPTGQPSIRVITALRRSSPPATIPFLAGGHDHQRGTLAGVDKGR